MDIPKANFENTNDENSSRRFFEEYKTSAAIVVGTKLQSDFGCSMFWFEYKCYRV